MKKEKDEAKKSRTYTLSLEQVKECITHPTLATTMVEIIEELPVLTTGQAYKMAKIKLNIK